MGSLIPRPRPCQNVPLFYLLYIISYLAKSSDAQRLAEDVMANLHLDDDDDDEDDDVGDNNEVEWFKSLKKDYRETSILIVFPICLQGSNASHLRSPTGQASRPLPGGVPHL